MLQEIINALGLSQEPKVKLRDPAPQAFEQLLLENELLRKDMEAQKHLMKLMLKELQAKDIQLQRFENMMKY